MNSKNIRLVCPMEDNNLSDVFDISIFGCKTQSSDGTSQDIKISINDDDSTITKYEKLSKFISDNLKRIPVNELEEKLFQAALPILKNLLCTSLQQNSDEISSKNTCQLKKLCDNLQLVVWLIDLVDSISIYIQSNTFTCLSDLNSYVVHVGVIILSVYKHCKYMKEGYFSLNLKTEIIHMFKSVQNIHSKYLQLLKWNLSVDYTLEAELLLLKQVLEITSEIAELLLHINLKSSADSWLTYLNILQMHYPFAGKKICTAKPVKLLTDQILGNLLKVMENDLNHGCIKKNKTLMFLIKVLSKLLDLVQDQIDYSEIFKFVGKVLNFCDPLSSFTDESMYYIEQELPLNTIMEHKNFMEVCCINSFGDASADQEYGFFMLFIQALRNAQNVDGQKVTSLLNVLFDGTEKYCIQLLCKVPLQETSFSFYLYEDEISCVTCYIANQGQYCYPQIELILFQKLLSDNAMVASLALEIWCSILRLSPPTVQFATFNTVVKKMEKAFRTNCGTLPQIVFIEAFLKEVFQYLSYDCKKTFLDERLLEENLHIWRHIGVKHMPHNLIFLINQLVLKNIRLIDSFLSNGIDKASFLEMCEMWEVISTVDIINLYIRRIINPLARFWERLNWIQDIGDLTFYKYYTYCLFKVTNRFISSMTNLQILTVLTQIKNAISTKTKYLREYSMTILKSLSDKLFHRQNGAQLMEALSEILMILLDDPSPIIRQDTLKLLETYVTTSPHKEIVQRAISDAKSQLLVSNFLERNVDCDKVRMLRVLQNVYDVKSKSVLRSSDDDEASEAMGRKTKRFKFDKNRSTHSGDALAHQLSEQVRMQIVSAKEEHAKSDAAQDFKVAFAEKMDGLLKLL